MSAPDLNNTLNNIFGIFGLLAGLVGMWFSYITYTSPMVRFRWYLKHKNNWKQVFPRAEGQSDYYQYLKHQEFTIEEVDDRRWDHEEPWITKTLRPDKNLHSYQVALKVNGNIIHTENFIFMDGGRYYVPIPRVEYAHTDNENDNIYYYESIQVLLADVLGKYHNDKSLEEFCKLSGILLGYKPTQKKGASKQ